MSKCTISLEEKMISEAEFGFYNMYHMITPKKAEELRQLGFSVSDMHENRSSPRIHRIDWSEARYENFEYSDIQKLNEDDAKYTLPQKLWIITTKVKNNPTAYYKSH